MTTQRDIPYYEKYVSDALLQHLLSKATSVVDVDGLVEVGECSGLESTGSLQFACELYERVKDDLNRILEQRETDRKFIDEKTLLCRSNNEAEQIDFFSSEYQTIIDQKDEHGRKVVGPLLEDFYHPSEGTVADVPDWLTPPHITLFGPPDSKKMAINAMNSYHRKLADEPEIVEELLLKAGISPKWGADDEDSKTPFRSDLMQASENLFHCFDGTLSLEDKGKKYEITKENRALPIKRIPGFALPSFFLFYHSNPLPLHIYDFALHLFHLWDNPQGLVFYVPKLENEEEAIYLKKLIETAENMIKELHPEYEMGTVRLMIVVETPRIIFRVNEVIDALHPYFLGASLGWHDYLASTARVFKEDPNYRIPVKSDPDIVVKYIKASHDLVASVVGGRSGVKLGGMYGILPMSGDINSGSFQVSIKGFFKDVITQFNRDLDGFWVAHPDFVRVGIALTQAWQEYKEGDRTSIEQLIREFLLPAHQQDVFDVIYGEDVESLDYGDRQFARSLLVADLKESQVIANNDEEEVRYNIFQSLQYITDWLCGNGCVALPASIEGNIVRVMDDLATAERSRWEVWHEVYHGRFDKDRLIEIAFEELEFIQKGEVTETKSVQVGWNSETEKWYPIAMRLMLKMMTDEIPVESATELMLPFTLTEIQEADNPWTYVCKLDTEKFLLAADIMEQVEKRLN